MSPLTILTSEDESSHASSPFPECNVTNTHTALRTSPDIMSTAMVNTNPFSEQQIDPQEKSAKGRSKTMAQRAFKDSMTSSFIGGGRSQEDGSSFPIWLIHWV